MTTSQIIENLGGTTAVAHLCEVTPGAVSQWKREGIPAARVMYLRAVRPEAFQPSTIPPEVVEAKEAA